MCVLWQYNGIEKLKFCNIAFLPFKKRPVHYQLKYLYMKLELITKEFSAIFSN